MRQVRQIRHCEISSGNPILNSFYFIKQLLDTKARMFTESEGFREIVAIIS